MELNVNGVAHSIDVEPDMPLLWAIREVVGLTGTKYGCGVAQCGACSVQLNGELVRSCSIPVSVAAGQKITTIEGISKDSSHAVQKAWLALDIPQCGYCQSGQIMAAVALLKRVPKPSDADIDAAMSNICRCGTYQRIRDGIHVAAGQQKLEDVLKRYADTGVTGV
ncbi:isoquinoline 1-oxidoreductase alpha subunit [Jezberella montanilacus]|jgi:isoquinoline 1-oxidoreductase alpha subunit|uniref:Isoquinoline 1-oxidoreductase alpha subunit n=1 Tax=Jezberella montanilacus TaxID=323426 RepID=A0A2T0XJD3_9BURK|nr:(2Fe-2S)-binding protein [Jezberella montanilacus]PRY99007.1 isoquinoline 1-oxidoreductase alpha subunit [Jezberella montanilacus]